MNKKSLLFLLIIPFVISIFAFLTSTFVIWQAQVDIERIDFSYQQNQAFMLSDGQVKLEASPVYDSRYPLSEGNDLIWKVSEQDTDSPVAEVRETADGWYLRLLNAGICTVICSNEKGNVSRSFSAVVVGEGGAIVVNPAIPFSQSTISGVDYVGMYDLSYETLAKDSYEKIPSEFPLIIETYGLEESARLSVKDAVNCEVDLDGKTVIPTGEGEVSFSIVTEMERPDLIPGSYSFTSVDGVNIYSYEDLMMATNYSNQGEVAVMRVNLESFDNTYEAEEESGELVLKNSSTRLFGRLAEGTNGSSIPQYLFQQDVYRFTTTYNHEFLDQYNREIARPEYGRQYASTDIVVGVRIQKDFYGNGFTVNADNLAKPSLTTTTEVDGVESVIYTLSDDDLFRGPRIFVSLGTPKTQAENINPGKEFPIFALYGQDNIGFYVDGDDIHLEDVNLKNVTTSAGNFMNFRYAGTVLEFAGDRNSISNSIVQNGRNVIRSFSSMDLSIDNCLIQNGMEFLLRLGSNEGNKVDGERRMVYWDGSQNKQRITGVETYLSGLDMSRPSGWKNYMGDSMLSYGIINNTQTMEFVSTVLPNVNPSMIPPSYTREELEQGVATVAEALTNTEGILGEDGIVLDSGWGGSCVVKDTFFYSCGLSPICLDTLPQGSYLYNNISTLFSTVLGPYIDLYPENLAMTAKPVHLSIQGDTRFYTWNDPSNLNFSTLIEQNLNAFILAHGGVGANVNITDDDYLPLREMLVNLYSDSMVSYQDFSGNQRQAINLPIMFMGGGYNASVVDIESDSVGKALGEEISLDPYVYSLDRSVEFSDHFTTDASAKYQTMKVVMGRAASCVLGFNPYRYLTLSPAAHKWLGETPSTSDLVSHLAAREVDSSTSRRIGSEVTSQTRRFLPLCRLKRTSLKLVLS